MQDGLMTCTNLIQSALIQDKKHALTGGELIDWIKIVPGLVGAKPPPSKSGF